MHVHNGSKMDFLWQRIFEMSGPGVYIYPGIKYLGVIRISQ
jgi:hypothetical protein